MRIRRRLPIILAVLLVAAAVALAVVLRKHAPPEPARLLPGADGFVYVNLGWMRRANIVGQLPPVPHDPDYEKFIQATGFQFERDLDEAALAIHYPGDLSSGKAESSPQPRYSEVFVGKIDDEKLRAYLRQISNSVDNYETRDIFNIPLEGRTLRVAILGVDTVAASNLDDPLVIRGIISRSRKLASPFGGPALLRQYYKDVPFASLGWAVLKVQPSENVSASGTGLSFLFQKPAIVVASIRYLGAVHFKAQAIAASSEDASQLAGRTEGFLNLFHTAESTVSTPGLDPDIKALFDSLKIQADKNRAVLTAIVPLGLIRKALAEGPTSAPPEPQPPQSSPTAAPRSKTKGRK
ncbi:MAG: hypothetical protein WB711_15355 [Terriglobales bacterium]